jgi:methylated-DNA-[protein]-cysteine S-methyltransferase
MVERTLFLERIDTPTGAMLVVVDSEQRLHALDWEDHTPRLHKLLRRHYGANGGRLEDAAHESPAAQALRVYFEGQLDAVGSLPVATAGTEFQRTVWNALRTIPAGETISYGTLAAKIGRPSAMRAVGLANGANPIAIAVPCHRVIGADSSLTGYGGGLERKHWLLDHERRHLAKDSQWAMAF